jgi:outer membrane protein TolC
MICALFGLVAAIVLRQVFATAGIDRTLPAPLLVYLAIATAAAFAIWLDGSSRQARVAIALSDVEAARASLDNARDAAVRHVTDAYDSLHTSFAEYSASLTLNETARTAYDASLDSYRHGVGTYTDVANNETALTQAQSAQQNAHADVFTAAAALAFATGSSLSQR